MLKIFKKSFKFYGPFLWVGFTVGFTVDYFHYYLNQMPKETSVNIYFQLYVIHYLAKNSKSTTHKMDITDAVSLYMRLCEKTMKRIIKETKHVK